VKNVDIAILIPAYNPTHDLISLTNELIKSNYTVVIVNDGSNKKCNNIFNNLNKNAIILKHEENQGKGRALKTGFEYIKNNIECTGVVTADADGQHITEDIINIANKLKKFSNELILGSRKQNKDMMLRSRIGNYITKIIFKLATKTKVYDTQTGLRGIPFEFLEKFIYLKGDRYEYEMNMLIYCIKHKIKITEIPIKTIYINNNKASSFKLIKDSLKIYKSILTDSDLLNIFLFGISAIFSFLIDFTLLLIIKKLMQNLYVEDISLLISVIVARIVSSLFNFIFNRNVVFKNKDSLVKSFIQYYILVLFVMAANYLLLNILSLKLNINLIVSKIIVEVILFIINYIIQKLIIFKKKPNN